MASAAQLINNIHTSFLAVGDRFTVTPVFHVFEMYAPHQGGQAVRAEFSATPVSVSAAGTKLAGLSGSCSVKGKQAILTVVNPDLKNAQDTEIVMRGASIQDAKATVLTASDMRAHNTLAQPHALEPKEEAAIAGGPGLQYTFKPASVTRLELSIV